MTPEQLFEQIKTEAENDPSILGFFLEGSRGKGLVTKYSDYDAVMVVKELVKQEYKVKYEKFRKYNIEINVMTLNELQEDAKWGSPTFWNAYNYAHLNVYLDRIGELQKIIAEKAAIPAEKTNDFISSSLDHYINQVYRSLKCFRDGNETAAQLEATESIEPLLNAVFGLEGRVRPYYKYLEWELANFPLSKLPWDSGEFINSLLTIVKTASMKVQQQTLKIMETVFRGQGFNKAFDDWGEKLTWMKNYK